MGKTFTNEQDLFFCEDFSLQCIMLLLEEAPSTYHAYKLLNYLADSKYGYTFDRHGMEILLFSHLRILVFRSTYFREFR